MGNSFARAGDPVDHPMLENRDVVLILPINRGCFSEEEVIPKSYNSNSPPVASNPIAPESFQRCQSHAQNQTIWIPIKCSLFDLPLIRLQ